MHAPATYHPTTMISRASRRQLFNAQWRFSYGDAAQAYRPSYDDSAWELLQLPHDYSLNLPYTQAGEAESGYKLGGVAWYRKAFALDSSVRDKRVVLEFGGVYMNATVYINGHKLGDHPYGYTPFAYELTEYLHPEEENVLAVRVDHRFPSSRWYSGSGIYRDVHLIITEPIHVEYASVRVRASGVDAAPDAVELEVRAVVCNPTAEAVTLELRQSLQERDSARIVASATHCVSELGAGVTEDTAITLQVSDPTLWSLDQPYLYDVVTEILVDGQVVDRVLTEYGFRTAVFDAERGFLLNGEPVKLQGVSMHSDQGALGAAAHERAIERQVEILQDMGANAIRVTHNPADDTLIEIANRKGMLLIDEAFDTWVDSKNGNIHDYAVWFAEQVGDNPLLGATPGMTWAEFDLKAMVKRGRNAPSIISWSVGNEVMEGNSGPYTEYPAILAQLVDWVAEVDPTRPATIGDNKLKANWGEAVEFGHALAAADGVLGFNYAEGEHLDAYHEAYPEWRIYAAETASAINSRGVYAPSQYNKHLTAYDESTVGWGKLAADSWYTVIKRDYVAGEFVWTGFDYLGEPTPWNNVGPGATGGWPSPKSSYFGIIDTAGLPKDSYYFYRSQWNKQSTTLHLLPAWQEGQVELDTDGKVRVDVYSNARHVELFFRSPDGAEHSLGKQSFTPNTTAVGHQYQLCEDGEGAAGFRQLYLSWQIPYADGTLLARAYDAGGQVITETVGRSRVSTYGEPASVEIASDRDLLLANGRDLAYLTMTLVDASGEPVADGALPVQVTLEGDGTLLALDNGDQVDHEPYDSGRRKAFSGQLVAIVQTGKSPGPLSVRIQPEGLPEQAYTLSTVADPDEPSAPQILGYTLPKHGYVALGQEPELATEVLVRFSDGREEARTVTWELDAARFANAGTVAVHGVVSVDRLPVTAYVTVIESVGTLLNVALATATGVDRVSLPASRPLVTQAGEILETEIPVTWDPQQATDYTSPGQLMIAGRAELFGETLPVTASIRVVEPELILGDDVAPNYLTYTQDIPESTQDQKRAELTWTYATAQYLGAAELYIRSADGAAVPEGLELYWSNEGTEDAQWTRIEDVVVSSEQQGGEGALTRVRASFPGVSAVGFKLVGSLHDLAKVALRVVRSTVPAQHSAELKSLTVNGSPVSAETLQAREIRVSAPEAVIEVETVEHAAITILESSEDTIRVMTESEGQGERGIYTIHLNTHDE